MNDTTRILLELQELKTDLKYVREYIDKSQDEHEKLDKEVAAIRVTLVDHIAKIKGFGILLGIAGSIWTVLKIVQI